VLNLKEKQEMGTTDIQLIECESVRELNSGPMTLAASSLLSVRDCSMAILLSSIKVKLCQFGSLGCH